MTTTPIRSALGTVLTDARPAAPTALPTEVAVVRVQQRRGGALRR